MNNNESIIQALTKYANLLDSIRRYCSDISLEVRCSSVNNGPNQDCFSISGDGYQDKYLMSSYALPITAFSCLIGNCYCIQRAYRSNEERSQYHLSEFDVIEMGLCNTDCNRAMILIADLIIHVISDMKKRFEISKDVSDVNMDSFRYITWKEAIVNNGGLCNEDINKSPGGKIVHDLSHSMNISSPFYLIDIPYSKSSWASKMKSPRITTRFNLLCPYVGEIAEGSERNLNASLFKRKFSSLGLAEKLDWYADALDNGKDPLTVFSIGIERLAMWIFGYKDIRECHPYMPFISPSF